MSKIYKVIFKLQILPKKHNFYSFFNLNGNLNGPLNSKVFHHGGHLLSSPTKMTNNLILIIFYTLRINKLDFNGKLETSFLTIFVNAFLAQFLRYLNTVIFKDIKNNTLEKNAF